MKTGRRISNKGFTLVELLIVVIILAILAAIVVPQFSSSTTDAREAALVSSLANLRSAIDMYYKDHGSYPASALASGATCPGGGTAGGGAALSEAAFMSQLSQYTNLAGLACSTTDTTFQYGPYLKKDAMPANPISGISTLLITNTGNLLMTGNATAAGWKFDVQTGKFIADDAAFDDR